MLFSSGGFRAFDGSSKYFRRLGLYDLDCCSLPGDFRPDDGYFVVERSCDCCDQCIVVESARWYAANGYAVGSVITCPSPAYAPPGVFNSATKISTIVNDFCCNGDGSRIYAELTEEINDANPLP